MIVVQRLRGVDKSNTQITDEYILARPFGLLTRTRADKTVVAAVYCADAEDLLVNFVYQKMAKPNLRHDTFQLVRQPTESHAVLMTWRWERVTVEALITMKQQKEPEPDAAP